MSLYLCSKCNKRHRYWTEIGLSHMTPKQAIETIDTSWPYTSSARAIEHHGLAELAEVMKLHNPELLKILSSTFQEKSTFEPNNLQHDDFHEWMKLPNTRNKCPFCDYEVKQ